MGVSEGVHLPMAARLLRHLNTGGTEWQPQQGCFHSFHLSTFNTTATCGWVPTQPGQQQLQVGLGWARVQPGQESLSVRKGTIFSVASFAT